MSDELYKVLGLKKDASQASIKKAYRALAKKHHPDLNPGNKKSEETFRKAQATYDILSDEKKRHQYDAGEINAEGKETPRRFYHEYAAANGGGPYSSSTGYDDLGDIFSEILRSQHQRGGEFHIQTKGSDINYKLAISFLDAANGSKKTITMADGKTLNITIPAGHRDGQVLRLRGKGMAGIGEGKAGDALIEIQVLPHKVFNRQGQDIQIDLPVAIDEAILGGKVHVPTIRGPVSMTVPPDSNAGDILRLKGKGISAIGKKSAGDQFVTLNVMLPEKTDAELKAFIKGWAEDHKYNPRQPKEG